MGLFALLARVFPSFTRKEAPQFAAAPLAPRRLERRRVFDGAAAGVVLEALPAPEPYVQTSEPLVATQEATQQPLVAAAASSLQATIRLRSAELFEDQSVLAVIEIVDSPPMAHQITIDWGDGSLQVINVGPSTREALAVHRFLDDNPSGTASDVYTVTATVTNPVGGSSTSSTTILVKNVAPKIDSLTITPSINENDSVVLSGTYSDPGTLDTHSLDIDWNGDGTYDQTVAVTGGAFSISRQVLDDNPTGTASDVVNVNVRLRDDDGGSATRSTSFVVNNLNPQFLTLTVTSPITENGFATLTGTYKDTGTQDTHELDIDWDGDGSFDETVTVSGGSFAVNRQYLDDPAGINDNITINVRLRDDDGGSALAATTVTVENANPVVLLNPLLAIDENGTAVLTGTYSDVGTQDTHELDIDWDGDNIFDQTVIVTGGAFTVTRQFLDDNPTGTPSDTFNVNVRLRDDDGGMDTKATVLTVNNKNPEFSNVTITSSIDENGTATLTGTYTDVGTQDTHELDIDWDGDGNYDETVTVSGGSFSVSRQFLDDNPTGTPSDMFNVNVRLRDDDGGTDIRSTVLTVKNVPPKIDSLTITPSINENDTVTLTGTYSDQGSLDTHELDIDWDGDGNYDQTVSVTGGAFSVTRQVLDDNPTATNSDVVNVNVRLRDDDGGSATESTSFVVNNVNPDFLNLTITSPIIENGTATLTGTYQDTGTQDTHELDIDWDGDGNFDETVTVSGGSFSVSRQFLDDNPTGTSSDTFNVHVRLRDDDGGVATDSKPLTVNNSNPSVVLVPPTAIEENQSATLQGSITDVGTLDTFKLTINWGDPASPNNVQNFDLGTTPLTQAADGINWDPVTRTFSLTHQYLDDNPSGTPDDIYTISVTATDDDLGVGTAETTVLVKNVGFTVVLQPVSPIDENGSAELKGTINDPGTRDTFELEINWGDPASPDNVETFNLGDTPLTQAADGIDWDPVTRTFTVRRQYLDDNPSATGSDTYTINIKVTGDDLSTDTETTSVLVRNIAPQLTFQPVTPIDENGTAVLEGHVSDPGTLDTFTIVIDWQDPLSPNNTQTFTLGNTALTEAVDGINWDPTTRVFSLSHQYLDDNPTGSDGDSYPVTVVIADDDTGFGLGIAPIEVRNVDPVVLLDPVAQIDEGGVATLTGSFTDVGLLDTHTVTIDWGDGTPPTVLTNVGANGAGSFTATHTYADNDTDSVIDPFKAKDNLYTITVKVVDDDQGLHAPTTLVKVLNVVPALDPIIATDVTPQGFTTLTLTFQDPGADSFQIMVDWGDNLHLPPQDRFELERVYAGPTPNTFILTHQYAGPPNPANPSADIVISVMILDDDFNVAGVVDNGPSNVESIAISNPGIGAEAFRIDTTPQVPQLSFPPRVDPQAVIDNSTANLVVQQNIDLRAASGDSQTTADRYIELRVIDAEGNEGPGYRLRPEVLQDLPGLFRKLPDNHYAVYVVNMETNTRRLVIEVYVRNGKLIDPGDDSEGTRDRPPTDEQMIQPPAVEPSDAADAGPQAAIPVFEIEESRQLSAWPRNAARWSAIAVGLAASASSQTWVNRVDQTLAQATAQQWRKLQGHNPPKPKNQ